MAKERAEVMDDREDRVLVKAPALTLRLFSHTHDQSLLVSYEKYIVTLALLDNAKIC